MKFTLTNILALVLATIITLSTLIAAVPTAESDFFSLEKRQTALEFHKWYNLWGGCFWCGRSGGKPGKREVEERGVANGLENRQAIVEWHKPTNLWSGFVIGQKEKRGSSTIIACNPRGGLICKHEGHEHNSTLTLTSTSAPISTLIVTSCATETSHHLEIPNHHTTILYSTSIRTAAPTAVILVSTTPTPSLPIPTSGSAPPASASSSVTPALLSVAHTVDVYSALGGWIFWVAALIVAV